MSFENTEKEHAKMALETIKSFLNDIEGGDENVAYADTSDSMDSLDELLGQNTWYQESLEKRRSASRKIMSGDMSGIKEVQTWIQEVESKL